MQKNRQLHLINGPAGDIEVRLHSHESSTEKGLVVISHPHPLFGGTMNNKVVTTMEKAFFQLGFDTLAYNFRGVGSSQGEYDEGIGEVDDLLAVSQWQKANKNYAQTLFAGFSFGSYVSLKASKKSSLDSLCLVAPPVGLYDFSDFNHITTDWLVIQGGADEVVDVQEVKGWIAKQQNGPDIYWRNKASHFFHGELIWLRDVIATHFR
ncbi:alpha/beta hydrolase [Thiomicrorhabdus sediminis]|uniref:Xaa-Pro dipeptidyl-peptidase-like domain-containing protein n=1 Tax=Thiomicrorhabdus sediminis TaxID=2580412 RepID=A0A4P9K8J2_9GAMM|nr:CocE/NonD family hydrolase [Thiomicrorhabdus sediminis]QCU90726.1 hypothetical protein FE785_08845 [Thiomicrorhabdus sediminis]